MNNAVEPGPDNSLAEWVRRDSAFDVDDLGTAIHDIVQTARDHFHASAAETIEIVRLVIADLQRRGAVPTRMVPRDGLNFLEPETMFGDTPEDVRETVMAAWLVEGGVEEGAWRFRFMTPAAIVQHNHNKSLGFGELLENEARARGLAPSYEAMSEIAEEWRATGRGAKWVEGEGWRVAPL